MPEFIAEHTPPGLDAFTRGYLDAAEWLLDEEIDREAVECWAAVAVTSATEVCRDFQDSNADDLARYYDITGRDEYCAGMDFWLTRNRHGAGFWDRGNDPVFASLTDMANPYGGTDAYLGDDNQLYFT